MIPVIVPIFSNLEFMKIGIITVHRAYNYGSVLQCYALQECLKKLGHDVWVIDYRQRWTEAVYQKFSLYYIWHFLQKRDIHAIIGYWRSRAERRDNLEIAMAVFVSFMKKLRITKSCRHRLPKGFDRYLIGSDQLWSHQCVGGEDKIYTGDFKCGHGGCKIGYAISAGTVSLYKFGEKKLKRILSNFSRLSLREEENARIVEQLTGVALPVTVDPTLLTDASDWDDMINEDWQDKRYIAIYQARPVSGNPTFLHDKAKILAESLECEIINLSDMTYTVEDFLSIIKYARYVLTTSFHATVFSILMETPCFAIKLNDGFDVRYTDLLTKLGLEKEIVEKDFHPEPFETDFTEAKRRLIEYRGISMDFLKSL